MLCGKPVRKPAFSASSPAQDECQFTHLDSSFIVHRNIVHRQQVENS